MLGLIKHAIIGFAGSLINLNGDFLTVGFQAIRGFDPVAKKYSVVGKLDRARFDPTLVTLGDGNVLVLGGTQQVLPLRCLLNVCDINCGVAHL